MTVVNVTEGYRQWASSYADETAISYLENKLVAAITPLLDGLMLLDAGCGTGRRLRDSGAASAVGVDLSPEMLDAGLGQGKCLPDIRMMTGDIRDLPLPDRMFDVVWCRLVIGHLPDCRDAYAELARVTNPGGTVIVSDFHPAADAAGHRRSFRIGDRVIAIEHHVHTIDDHLAAARAVGLEPIDNREAAIGPDVRDFYDRAGRPELYREHLGLPVVLALAFRRER